MVRTFDELLREDPKGLKRILDGREMDFSLHVRFRSGSGRCCMQHPSPRATAKRIELVSASHRRKFGLDGNKSIRAHAKAFRIEYDTLLSEYERLGWFTRI